MTDIQWSTPPPRSHPRRSTPGFVAYLGSTKMVTFNRNLLQALKGLSISWGIHGDPDLPRERWSLRNSPAVFKVETDPSAYAVKVHHSGCSASPLIRFGLERHTRLEFEFDTAAGLFREIKRQKVDTVRPYRHERSETIPSSSEDHPDGIVNTSG